MGDENSNSHRPCGIHYRRYRLYEYPRKEKEISSMGGIGKTVPPFEYEGGELLEGRKTNGRQL